MILYTHRYCIYACYVCVFTLQRSYTMDSTEQEKTIPPNVMYLEIHMHKHTHAYTHIYTLVLSSAIFIACTL